MTSSEMPTRIAMPQPFASGASATRATIESTSGDNLNYVDGFPGKYSLPASEGGKYVSRGEMNAIGNMASNDLHYFKCGGLNTFDASFCAAIGGYPKGAVLDYINGYKLYKVMSLVEGNAVNFLDDGIDGINWKYLNQDTADAERDIAFQFSISSSSGMLAGVFKSLKTADTVLAEAKIEKTYLEAYTQNLKFEGTDVRMIDSGAGILMYDLGTSYTDIPDRYDGWHLLYGSPGSLQIEKSSGSTYVTTKYVSWVTSISALSLKQNHYYAVLLDGGPSANMFQDAQFVSQEGSATTGVDVTVSIKPFSLTGTYKIFY